jgi:hypothetical protein
MEFSTYHRLRVLPLLKKTTTASSGVDVVAPTIFNDEEVDDMVRRITANSWACS